MTQEQSREDVRSWFYAQVAKLDLARTDCPGIFRTTKGFTCCHYVKEPDADWTLKRAEEYIEILARELVKCGHLKK